MPSQAPSPPQGLASSSSPHLQCLACHSLAFLAYLASLVSLAFDHRCVLLCGFVGFLYVRACGRACMCDTCLCSVPPCLLGPVSFLSINTCTHAQMGVLAQPHNAHACAYIPVRPCTDMHTNASTATLPHSHKHVRPSSGYAPAWATKSKCWTQGCTRPTPAPIPSQVI